MRLQDFWTELLDLIEEKAVIPVVGRDLLVIEVAGQRTHLYSYLAARLAETLAIPAPPPDADDPLQDVVERHLASQGDLYAIYKNVKWLMPSAEIRPPDGLLKLAAMKDFSLFITTTFDNLLERAVNDVRFGGDSRTGVLAYFPGSGVDFPRASWPPVPPVIFHLLGRASVQPHYALTEEDVLEFMHALQLESKRPQVLLDELKNRHLLVIGSGFPDWLARFFLRTARSERLWLARGQTTVADRTMRDDRKARAFLSNFRTGVRVFAEGGAEEFVDELHRRWQERHPDDAVERPASDMPPGAIFLSYASEDVASARDVRAALDAAGLDVWFDKSELEPGDQFDSKIRKNIERCSLFVPIISMRAIAKFRPYLRQEWSYAERVAERVPPNVPFIMPVVIDDTPKSHEALPERFRRVHWEHAPQGHVTPEFVSIVKRVYRELQRSVSGR